MVTVGLAGVSTPDKIISAGGAVVTYPRRLAWPLRLVAALAPRWLWRRMLRRDRGELA